MRRLLLTLLALSGCEGAPTIPKGIAPPRRPPANAVGGFSIEIPTLTLMPGQERSPCYIFPIVIDGPSRMVGGGTLTVGQGVHHGNITTRPKTGEGVRACPGGQENGFEALDIALGGSVLFGSSTQIVGEEWQSFPSGMAYRIKHDHEIVARMHYLNASSAPLAVDARYQWYTVDEARVTQELTPFAWDLEKFSLPPRATTTIGVECMIPRPMRIVSALPHMHRLGTAFRASFVGGPRDGQRFLDSPGYDPDNGVLLYYEPAVDLGQGDGMRFECTWENSFDKVITQGIGDNEMCILFGYAYPKDGAFSALAADNGSCVTSSPP